MLDGLTVREGVPDINIEIMRTLEKSCSVGLPPVMDLLRTVFRIHKPPVGKVNTNLGMTRRLLHSVLKRGRGVVREQAGTV